MSLKFAVVISAMACMTVASCAQYVKRGEFDSTISGLHATDQQLAGDVSSLRTQFGEMTGDLHNRFQNYDAKIADFEGRVRVEMTAHFGFNDHTLRDEDKPALDEFAAVIRKHPNNVIVTVEGFTDPSGPPEYNQWLGQERANAVREYMIGHGGLDATKVRAVSYGEDQRRLLKNASGSAGAANRRVALVVDYVGATQ